VKDSKGKVSRAVPRAGSSSDGKDFERLLSACREALSRVQESIHSGELVHSRSAQDLVALREALHQQYRDEIHPEALARLLSLDEEIRPLADRLVALIGAKRWARLRETHGSSDGWWWKITAPVPIWRRALTLLEVAALGFSLVVLMDVFGRLFLGTSDPSTLALQSLIGLAAGGSGWQLAKTFLETSTSRRWRIFWVLLILVTALVSLTTLGRLADWYVQRGIDALEEGKTDQALGHFERGQRLRPSGLGSYYTGVARERLGDAAAASQAYVEAIALDPKLASSYNNLARLQITTLKRPDLALALLEEQSTAQPTELAFLRKNRAWALLELGHPRSAAEEILAARKNLAGAPLEAALTCLEGQVLEALKRLDGLESKDLAEKRWQECHEYASGGALNIEATWKAMARERAYEHPK